MDSKERRLHDAKLGAAIDNASVRLPEEYMISISIMPGSIWVNIIRPDGDEMGDVFRDKDLPDAIYAAIDRAIEDSKTYTGTG